MARPSHPARLLQQRLRTLLEALPAATSGDATSVHRARVASRRLRAVLPVLTAVDARTLPRARKHVRRITRALGPIRELDVALGHLDDLGPRSGIAPAAVAQVRQALVAERQRHRRAMLDVITPAALARLAETLEASAAEPRRGPGTDADRRLARRRSADRARTLAAAIRRSGTLYLPERLHDVRIAAKKLRYALEIERDLTRSRATRRLMRLKRLQDALGEMHDYEMLADRIREVQTGLSGSDPATADRLVPLVRTLEEACRDHHAAFLRERLALLALCRTITTAAREGRSTLTG